MKVIKVFQIDLSIQDFAKLHPPKLPMIMNYVSVADLV